MAWQNPITTWGQSGQTVPGATDFNRIEGNIQELQNTKETPAGAQAKAEAAAGAVQADLAAHQADYAYQTPVINGSQIQVTRLSDTERLYFRLEEDFISNEAITISLDEGATEFPLLDIEGEPVTELQKGFMEVIKEAVNFTLRPSGDAGKYEESNHIALIAFNAIYGTSSANSYINSLTYDGEYLYCGGNINVTENRARVYKINPTNMSKVAESVVYGEGINALTYDGEYLYCGGKVNGGNPKVWKIDPTDMSKVAETSYYGEGINALTYDGEYLYAAFDLSSSDKVYKINPTNMSKVAESADYGNNIYALVFDGEHIYCAGYTKVWKIDSTNMSKVAESDSYSGGIHALTYDGEYIYCVGSTSGGTVWKIDTGNMSKIAESEVYDNAYALTYDMEYIYCGNTGKITKIDPTNMSKLTESSVYDIGIRELFFDGKYIYSGGSGTSDFANIWKVLGTVYTKK